MDNNTNNNKNPNTKSWLAYLPYILLPILLISSIGIFAGTQQQTKDKTEYYEIIQLFDEGKVTGYTLNLASGVLEYKVSGNDETQKYNVPNVDVFLNDIHNLVRTYNAEHPDTPIKADYVRGATSSWITNLLPMLIITIVLIVAFSLIAKKMNQAMTNETNRTFGFGKARVKQAKDEKRKTTFDDVAGADEEKEELQEIVEFLKNPGKFTEIGARITKGVLLVGPPGTGKTLIARAVAGEANVPFFSISGSDFVEMYVGVGASRVRDLFEQAKKNSPAIIFIDEIDAVGRHRGAGMGGGHDEREQTLNQLLVEMDGFGANEGVIIIAATNRPDILDPALLRPGRFDRQITVGYPDLAGREAILKVHAKGKPLAPDVDLHTIACSTAGFTGADLSNLLNESALLAARRGLKAITMKEIRDATIKVMVGTEKKSHKLTDHEKKLTAFHEAGHAVSSFFLKYTDPVQEISIIPRGMAGGYTLYVPTDDKSYSSKNRMLDELVSLLGGRVAESIVLGDVSTGASNDIERATEIARKMVTKYGMSDKLGPIAFGQGNDEIFLGKDYSHMRNYSENTAAQIDDEINAIITAAYNRCRKILTDHMDKLNAVAKYLIDKEKMGGDVFNAIMNGEEVEEKEENIPSNIETNNKSEKKDNNITSNENGSVSSDSEEK